MKTVLWALAAFLLGYGSGIVTAVRAVEKADLSTVAERAVRDVAAAYEGQLDRSQIFTRFRAKYDECLAENAKLKRNRCLIN